MLSGLESRINDTFGQPEVKRVIPYSRYNSVQILEVTTEACIYLGVVVMTLSRNSQKDGYVVFQSASAHLVAFPLGSDIFKLE